jgi:hypothetical protein
MGAGGPVIVVTRRSRATTITGRLRMGRIGNAREPFDYACEPADYIRN